MKKRVIEYYDWSDVKKFLKEQLPDHFDVWRIWADLTCVPANNGSMIRHSLYYMMKDSHDGFINYLNDRKKYPKEDAALILGAIRKLDQYCDSEIITIYYSWRFMIIEFVKKNLILIWCKKVHSSNPVFCNF